MPLPGDAAPVVHSTYGTQQPAVVAWKDYKAVTRDLKQVYHTPRKKARCRRWMRSGRNGMHGPADKSQLAGKLAECCHLLRDPEASRKVIINNRQYGAPLTLRLLWYFLIVIHGLTSSLDIQSR